VEDIRSVSRKFWECARVLASLYLGTTVPYA
jgi:hypothetical protein